MIFRKLIRTQFFQFFRNYCHTQKSDVCPPNAYCRKGDQGESHTLSGDVHPKDHEIFHAVGVTEELLCFLGYTCAFTPFRKCLVKNAIIRGDLSWCSYIRCLTQGDDGDCIAKEHAREANHQYCDKLKRIQTVVIEISTSILNSKNEPRKSITNLHIKELEDWTRTYSQELPPAEKYIIPGGGVTSANLQLAKTVCRKTERCLLPFIRKGQLNKEVQVYLNRLSEFLCMLSRIAAKLDKQNEHIYLPTIVTSQENKKSD